MIKKVAVIALLIVVSLSVAGCTMNFNAPGSSASPTPTPTTTAHTIAQIASSDGSLSSFADFLNKANLTGVLDEPGNFTVFAPDDAAFTNVHVSKLVDWESNTTALRTLLLYHIIPKTLPSNVFTGSGTLTTLLGPAAALPYSVTGTNIKVGDATVTKEDINATNGVIHIIDTVLIPPSTK